MKMILPILLATTVAQANETRTKIAVIDTGISYKQFSLPYMCKNGVRNMTKYSSTDAQGHGSHIVHIIGSRIDASKYCIVSYKVWHNSDIGVVRNTTDSLRDILKDNSFKYVNISMSGEQSDEYELYLLKKLTDKGVVVNVAAGNNSKLLTRKQCNAYPACYKFKLNHNFNVVQAKDMKKSNYGSFTKKEKGRNISSIGGLMSGSSQATAIYTSKLINGL